MSSSPLDSFEAERQALLQAVQAVLLPLARLAVARGVAYWPVEEVLRCAFVVAAQEAQTKQGHAPGRMVSHIAAATGLTRREVARLSELALQPTYDPRATLASQIFTKWASDPQWGWRGKPRVLPRQGEKSFEVLARSVSQDVHPRTALDELIRLKLVHWDETSDAVGLLEEVFMPRDQLSDSLSFLGLNVGDHLQAAVDNVLSSGSLHFEQAVFAHGLSAQDAEALRALARQHWKSLIAEAVPMLEAAARARPANKKASQRKPLEPAHRVRLGMFTFHESEQEPATQVSQNEPKFRRKSRQS
jgi:hypothetical protein